MIVERSGATVAVVVAALVAGCDRAMPETPVVTTVDSPGAVALKGQVWADNWFAFYLGDRLIAEDSTPISTERSFNAEAFGFNADYPLQLNVVAKDFKENDTGLEYIGRRNQQLGDGGFIAQFSDVATGATVAVSNADWRCMVIHEAPVDRARVDEAEPLPGIAPCEFATSEEPDGWRHLGFDDREWPSAVEFSAADVRPKGGYDGIRWREDARLIWSTDLETHNTLLCRMTVAGPQQ